MTLSDEVLDARIGRGPADLIEQGEDFSIFGFHLFRHSLNHQVSFARGLFDRGGIFQAREKAGVGVIPASLSEFDGFVQVGADFGFGLASGRQGECLPGWYGNRRARRRARYHVP